MFTAAAVVEETLPVMRRVVGADHIVMRKPIMGSEDFAEFQKMIPGFYYFLGVANRKKGITAMVHTPDFDVDEDSLVIGVKVMANVLFDYLERHAP